MNPCRCSSGEFLLLSSTPDKQVAASRTYYQILSFYGSLSFVSFCPALWTQLMDETLSPSRLN